MANFKTHLTASTAVGLAYGGAAYYTQDMPLPACVLASGLCSVSGMLPDIDSGPGRPLQEITAFIAAVVPTLVFRHLLGAGLSQESIILVGAAVYVAFRFGLPEFLHRYTVHRGMFHSFPAAAIFGLITYLLFYDSNPRLRLFIAGGVVVGFLSHLLLDEIYSVEWNGAPRVKRSFGTALKFFAPGWWPNISAYGKLAALAFLVVKEPSLMEQIYAGHADEVVKELRQDLAQMPGSFWLPGLGQPEKKPPAAEVARDVRQDRPESAATQFAGQEPPAEPAGLPLPVPPTSPNREAPKYERSGFYR